MDERTGLLDDGDSLKATSSRTCPQPTCRSAGLILATTCLLLGALLLGAAFAIPAVINAKLQTGIQDLVVVSSEKSAGYDTFQSNADANDIPVWFRVYAWNCTNAEQYAAGLAPQPILEQVGPYVYRDNTVNVQMSFPGDGENVKYVQWEYYVFEPSMSVGDPNVDLITTANMPVAGVRMALGDTWWSQLLGDLFMSGSSSSIFMTQTVNDLVFGYNSSILELLNRVQGSGPTGSNIQANQTTPEEALETAGFSEQKTGKESLADIREFSMWNNMTVLPYWGSAEANAINGKDGLQFSPGVPNNKLQNLFVSSLFRHIEVSTSKSDTQEVHGIRLQNFRLYENAMLNASDVPANAGYYMNAPYGVLNLSSPEKAPIFMSKPHFLDADPFYLRGVSGMKPDRSLHDTVLGVEPLSGATMKANKRLQVNCKIDRLFLLNDKMESVYLPVVWFDEGSEISKELAEQFKASVYEAQRLSNLVQLVGWIAGPILLALAIGSLIYLIFFHKTRSQRAAEMYRPVNTTVTDDETYFDARRR